MREFKEWVDRVAPKMLGVIWVMTLFSLSLYLLAWSIMGILRTIGVV